MVEVILISVFLMDIGWLAWALWRSRHFPHRQWWRAGALLFFALMFTHFFWLLLNRRAHIGPPAPAPTLAIAYIWHLLILPLLSWLIVAGETIRALILLAKKPRQKPPVLPIPQPTPSAANPPFTRRQFLTMAAVGVPPTLTIITGLGGLAQAKSFRINRLTIDIPRLPPALDGVTIAHLSDLHAGRFTTPAVLKHIAAATNNLRADVIMLTGDLIDYAIADLPNALDAIRTLDAPGGIYMCEGNHDLFDDRNEFERQVRAAHLGMLINETATLRLRQHPVQLHGLRWGDTDNPHGHRRDGGAQANLNIIAPQRDPDAFEIALAHHPHAFDPATAMAIPLTLSGHTHGGQLMLTNQIGAGPMMFKYWSGLYRQGHSRLIVSNGAGNWLPLRINSPAEIGLLTLRRA